MCQKKMRGEPLDYDERKMRRNINLTDTAWSAIALHAKAANISKSEAIERWARSLPKPRNTENDNDIDNKQQSVSPSELRRGLSTEKLPDS